MSRTVKAILMILGLCLGLAWVWYLKSRAESALSPPPANPPPVNSD